MTEDERRQAEEQERLQAQAKEIWILLSRA